MFKRSSKKGQNIAEYAVLFAIVIGAAFAMQNFIKQRLQGAMAMRANGFVGIHVDQFNILDSSGNPIATCTIRATPFEPDRQTWSDSSSDSAMTMTTVRAGTITLDSVSNANVLTTKQ